MCAKNLIPSNVAKITYNSDLCRFDLFNEQGKITEVVWDSSNLDLHERYTEFDQLLSVQIEQGHFVEHSVNDCQTDYTRLEFGECDMCRYSGELCPKCGQCSGCCHTSGVCGEHPVDDDVVLEKWPLMTDAELKALGINLDEKAGPTAWDMNIANGRNRR